MQEKYQVEIHQLFNTKNCSYGGLFSRFSFFDIKQGTDNDVYLRVIGKENKIDFQKMNNKWKNDFERNSLSAFEIVAPPMGKIAFEIMK